MTPDYRRLLAELRHTGDHATGASHYVDGAWRHLGCRRCDIEARVDVALKHREAPELGAPNSGTATSRAAAAAILPNVETVAWRIMECLYEVPSARLTRDQIAHLLSMSPNTVRPRVIDLLRGGWIQRAGTARRPINGREVEILALTAKGALAVRERRATT